MGKIVYSATTKMLIMKIVVTWKMVLMLNFKSEHNICIYVNCKF